MVFNPGSQLRSMIAVHMQVDSSIKKYQVIMKINLFFEAYVFDLKRNAYDR